jgi:hypothetical protein
MAYTIETANQTLNTLQTALERGFIPGTIAQKSILAESIGLLRHGVNRSGATAQESLEQVEAFAQEIVRVYGKEE